MGLSEWASLLASTGRGAVVLVEPRPGEAERIRDASRSLGMHPFLVPLQGANPDTAIWRIGTEIGLYMGTEGHEVKTLDTFHDHLVMELDDLGNETGYVLVLDGIHEVGAGPRPWVDLFIERLPYLYDRMLGWRSTEVPKEHVYDPNGPAFIVVLIGDRPSLDRARELMRKGFDQLTEQIPWFPHDEVPILEGPEAS